MSVQEFSSSQRATKKALEQIYSMSYFGIGGHAIVVFIVAYLFFDKVAFSLIAAGVFLQTLILFVRIYTVYRYQHFKIHLTNITSVNRWLRYYLYGVLATGLAWGLSVVLVLNTSDIVYHFFLFTVIIGLAGAGLVTLGTILSIYLAFMLPMMGITEIWLLTQNEEIYYLAAILVMLLMLYYYMAARRYSLNFAGNFIEKDKAIRSQFEIVQRLSKAAEYRDNETGMHILRMSYYCYLLAKEYGMDEDHAYLLLHASAMHDIGKIGISDQILMKPGKLDADEWKIMQTHTTIGEQILMGSESKVVQLACSIAASHHEKWDGTGYPKGLKGDEIPLEGRISAICDVFDALVSERPYKKEWSNEEALEFMKEQSGKHFDPKLILLFFQIVPKIKKFQTTHQG
ncbi:MAG: HD domain-containing protein [Sulfurimonas sp.]|jgi:putative two-component system response regulator